MEGVVICSHWSTQYSDWSAVPEPGVIAVSASRQNQSADFPHETEGQKFASWGSCYSLVHNQKHRLEFQFKVV